MEEQKKITTSTRLVEKIITYKVSDFGSELSPFVGKLKKLFVYEPACYTSSLRRKRGKHLSRNYCEKLVDGGI